MPPLHNRPDRQAPAGGLSRGRRVPPPKTWTVEQDTLPVFEDDFLLSLRQQVVLLLSEGEEVVPRLPRVAVEVMRLADDPTASAASVSKVLKLDPQLAGRVMHAANAVWSRRSGARIPDLQRAVGRLGLGTVRNIVLGSALNQTVFRADNRPRMQDLWLRTVATAVACELIAKALRRRGEQGYMLGLLHAVGEPITIRVVEDLLATPELSGRLDLPQALAWALPGVAPQVTAHVLRRWWFPDTLVDQIAAALSARPGQPVRGVTALLIAGLTVQERCRAGGVSEATVDAFLDSEAAIGLGLDRDHATAIFERFPEALERTLT